MSNQLVEVFLGDPVDNPGELQVLNRLRADLEQRRVPARIFANFTTGSRQIDLLIVTERRMAQVEVKEVISRLPVIGKANGPWHKQLPNGAMERLDRNYFKQAHTATYAISDEMRALAKTGAVPTAPNGFFRDIDTVICFTPGIPAGSTFEPYSHVHVIGYDELVDRLTTAGPRPTWTPEHLDAFTRHLGVYPEADVEPEDRGRQRALELIVDYRDRYVDVHRAELNELIDIRGTVNDDPDDAPVSAIVSASRKLGLVAVVGASGMGKTHLALHASIELANIGALPIWVRCRDYVAGRLHIAVSRALATATTVRMKELIPSARNLGVPVVVILDGFNECPAESRVELLEQLNALRLWASAGAIITSTEPVPIADAPDITRVTLLAPEKEQRDALLALYGGAGIAESTAFTTALELSLAARCAGALPANASRADLFDAYVRRICPSEVTRTALRRLADRMNETFRLGLPTTEAIAAVRGVGSDNPQLIDDALASPLLSATQGRVAFSHESFGSFLAAEARVLSGLDPAALAATMSHAHTRQLANFAIGLVPDGDERAELLVAIADANLIASAVRGTSGPATTLAIRNRVADCLAIAAEPLDDAVLEIQETYGDRGTWRQPVPRTASTHALLSAAGMTLHDNLFIEEVALLLDATDARCDQEMRRLSEAGSRSPISIVVASTYGGLTHGADVTARELAATIVLQACEMARVTCRWDGPGHEAAATGTRMLTCTGVKARWSRLYSALQLMNPDASSDARELPEVLTDAWEAKGYHLRLQALRSTARFSTVLEGAERGRVLQVLNGLDAQGHLFLSTELIETLASFGDIEPVTTLEDITQSIAAVLAAPRDPNAFEAAAHIIGMQFENESIVGPYYEAIDTLPDDQQRQLFLMALKASNLPFMGGYIVRRFTELADPADSEAIELLGGFVQSVDIDSPMHQEPVEAHDAALAWFGKHDLALPVHAAVDGDLTRHAWQTLDRLTFAVLRGRPIPDEQGTRVWDELLELCPKETAVVFYYLKLGLMMRHDEGKNAPFIVLVRHYPEAICRLQQWLLELLATEAEPGFPWRTRLTDLERVALETLGMVGTLDTASWLRSRALAANDASPIISAVQAIERRLEN